MTRAQIQKIIQRLRDQLYENSDISPEDLPFLNTIALFTIASELQSIKDRLPEK